VRTPVGIGKPQKGVLSGVHPVDLSGMVLREVTTRAGVDPALVDDVIWGCVSQVGEQGGNVGRNAVLASGFPEDVTAVSIDRQCGSSQQAVSFAAAGVIAGHYDIVIAGGVESMSRVPMFSNFVGGDGPFSPAMNARYDHGLVNQGVSAEMIAEKWGLSRGYLDELAATSHQRAAAARDQGLFDEEIVAVQTEDGLVTQDQGIRPDTTAQSLAALKTPFLESGVVTAGNASQISDGSAALLIMSSARAAELGLAPLARIHTVVMAGVDPIIMLTGPIPATQKALKKAGLTMDDIGAFEVNEAFASVLGAWYADTGADPARTNINGGAIALGHPLGASGARLMTTLVHNMRRTGARYGLQTMCEGGGMANATILELL
jgi:acetyl-CoA acyltransferase